MTSEPVYEIARYRVITDEEVLIGHAQMFWGKDVCGIG